MASAKTTPARRRRPAKRRDPAERVLLAAVLFLVCLGLLMIYSVSSARAIIAGGDPMAQLTKQLIYAFVGLGLLVGASRMNPAALKRIAAPAVGGALVLLVMVLVLPAQGLPIDSVRVNGAKRWLALGPFQLQPSEVAKLALILWIAMMVARDPACLRRVGGIRPFLILTGAFSTLIVVQPDLGTTGTVVVLALAMVFVAGAPAAILGRIMVAVAGLVVMVISIFPYQRARVVSFLNPWDDATGAGFQAVQGQIAIGSGGIFGRGLGNGLQRANYLPEAHTDFISAIIGEELGLIGLFCVIGAFTVLGFVGFRAAMRARNLHERLLATGITSLLCFQAAVNLGQVFGLLPVTGVPLPLVSAGGTSLMVFLAAIGILINISRRGKRVATRRADDGGDTRRDRSGGDGRARQAGPGDRRRIAS